MKPCPNCHQEMRDGTVFCPHCGFRLAMPLTDSKLLTGSPIGDVILGIVMHIFTLIALNGLIGLASRHLYDFSILYSPLFSGIMYFIVAWKLKYKSLGAGVYWTYIVGIVAIIALFVIVLGVCLIGGRAFG